MIIQNIEQLLLPYLNDGKKFAKSHQERLLPPGENCGSTLLKVEVILREGNGKTGVLRCVAKIPPPPGVLWEIFDTAFTFKKEIGIYETVVPILNNFGEEHGKKNLLPFFAESYTSRISLDANSDVVDNDAVLLLKNLSEDGYEVCDRFVGFDRNTTILLMKDLATIHATAIAYKRAKPLMFQEKIMPLLHKQLKFGLNEEARAKHIKNFQMALSKYPDIKHLTQRVINGYNRGMDYLAQQRVPNELFGTLIHADLWINNILVKFVNGEAVSNKFIDFQLMEYGNPARDVIFLIYSSAHMDVLPFIDDLLLIYHKHFIDTLKGVNCDPSPFCYKKFLEQVDAAITSEFGHLMIMLPPIYTERGKATQLVDMKGTADMLPTYDLFHQNYFPRFKYVVEDFSRRGWI